MFLLAYRRWGMFCEEERLRLSDRNSILMTQNLSGIWSEALIGRQSSYIVLAIVYKWQTKDKRSQRSNVNTMNLKQNCQYLWSIVFSRLRSIWVLLIHRWTQHFSKINQEKSKIEQICIWNPMITGYWFTSSVWNFCCWVSDVPPHETSLSGDEREETSAVHRLQIS